MKILENRMEKLITVFLFLVFFASIIPQLLYSATDTVIKDRKQYEKSVRMRMPPQIFIDTLQKDLQAKSPDWMTFWQTFVVEDDEEKGEYVIIARTVERKWAFSLQKPDCPKPEAYDRLMTDIRESSGTPVRMDVLVGVKKKRSFFRYVVTVYNPMFEYWKNTCYQWSLPAGARNDAFYNENYTMSLYSQNLAKKVFELVKLYEDWKPPKKVQAITAMKGSGQELIGGDADLLSDDEKKLPVEKQKQLIEKKKLKK